MRRVVQSGMDVSLTIVQQPAPSPLPEPTQDCGVPHDVPRTRGALPKVLGRPNRIARELLVHEIKDAVLAGKESDDR